jgi:D-alanine--poly(phosphoribitol) ligase subunit 2
MRVKAESVQRIRASLVRAGLENIPADASLELQDFGMDSLMLALSVIEIEREFGVKFKNFNLIKDSFKTIRSLEKMIEELLSQ